MNIPEIMSGPVQLVVAFNVERFQLQLQGPRRRGTISRSRAMTTFLFWTMANPWAVSAKRSHVESHTRGLTVRKENIFALQTSSTCLTFMDGEDRTIRETKQ